MKRLLAATILALALAGCSAGAEGAVATNEVEMAKSYRFAPAAISVAPASTVTWTNNDNFTHNVRIDGEIIGTAEPGQSVTHTFDAEGTFEYDCSLHPTDMTGVVTVR